MSSVTEDPETEARRRIARAAENNPIWLDLSELGLTSVPDSIGQLSSLTELRLYGNRLTSLPESIGQLSSLTELRLYGNRLTSLPESIGQLSSLTKLSLSGNQLASLPDSMGQLTGLTELSLSGNQLASLPDSMGQLTGLTELSLSGNQLASLLDSIGQLTGLTKLSLENGQLTSLLDSMGQLTGLTELSLYGNRLTSLPDWIGQLGGLTKLSLSGNQLTSLPDSIGQLGGLTELSLSGNQLTSLPDSIGQLGGLTELSLFINQLTSVPDWIGRLTRLTELDLSHNQLTSVPDSIGRLTHLTKLDLSHNQLTSVPDSIGRLTHLTKLDLSHNQLTSVPDSIGRLTHLTKLDLRSNPQLTVPPEVETQGLHAVLAFLRARGATSIERWHSKVLIVGEATVGKTSLAKRLLGEQFDPNEPQTHGVRVRSLSLPHPARAAVTMALDLWDFGGQLEYRATQRFYLTDRSLFVLVWNSRARAVDGKITAWLDAVVARAPGSPILIVATHSDEHSPATLPGDLTERYPMIVAALTVDSRTGHGIDELRQAIARHAATLPLMGVRWPGTWGAAARAVSDLPGLTATEYDMFDAMDKAGVTARDEQQIICRVMHDLGQIAYFADTPELADKVILQPEWLDARITQSIDSQAVTDAGGVLTRAEREALWGDLAKAEKDRDLPDRLIRMMEAFDLAYRVGNPETSTDVALIVDRLPEARSADAERLWNQYADRHGMSEVGTVFKLTSRQAGIPTWFIAREHRYTTGLHWRHGALLEDRDPDTPAWALLTDDGRDQPTVTLRVTGTYPVRFHSVLAEAFNTIIEDRYPGLVEQRLVPCRCQDADSGRCTHAFTITELIVEATDPETDHKIRCPQSRRRIEAALMLDGLRGTGLTTELDALQRQIADQTSTLKTIEARQQDTLNGIRTLLANRADAGVHCPALFSIQPGRTRLLRRPNLTLTLWCEWPDGPHPLDGKQGRYTITQVPEALMRYLPYLRHLITLLGLVTPALTIIGTPLDERAQAGFAAAAKTLECIEKLTSSPAPIARREAPSASARLVRAENGADFRALHDMLRTLDPSNKKNWGGLSPVSRPEDRRIIYLCPQHTHELDYPYTAAHPTA